MARIAVMEEAATPASTQVLHKTTSKTFHLRSRDTVTPASGPSVPSKRLYNADGATNHAQLGAGLEHASPSKRHRTADWPLKNDDNSHNAMGIDSPSHAKQASRRKGKGKAATRPSKFQEGSLNDKPSKQPPPSYIGEEEAMEKYHANQASRVLGSNGPKDTDHDSTKPSGIFRFGRAIANALNPTTVWHGIWKEKETASDKTDPHTDRAEINEAYAAFKQGGFKGMKTTNTYTQLDNSKLDASRISVDATPYPEQGSFRDSGIDMGEETASTRPSQETRTGRLLKVPASPAPERSPRRRSFSQLRSPSLGDLKKVKSHIQLPSPRRKISAAPVYPSIEFIVAQDVATDNVGLRRQPSKKDIARVTKLNKRVSDLELKLDAARQELKHSLRDAPPVPRVPSSVGRTPFVPGALGSLPSERLLDQQIENVARERERSANPSPRNVDAVTWRRTETTLSPNPPSRPHIGLEAPNPAKHMSATTTGSSRKVSRAPAKDVLAPGPTGIKKKPLPKLPRAPRNSPKNLIENKPPIPASLPESPDVTPKPPTPMKTRSRTQKRGVSPPPPSLASGKKIAPSPSGDAEVAINEDASPVLGRQSYGVPKRALRRSSGRVNAMRVVADKPLPDVQKEDFEWDEDVF